MVSFGLSKYGKNGYTASILTHPGTIDFANYSILILINTKDKLRKSFNYKNKVISTDTICWSKGDVS